MSEQNVSQSHIIKTILKNRERELSAIRTYEELAHTENDPLRKKILFQLADAEKRHLEKWDQKLARLGVTPPAIVVSLKDRIQSYINKWRGQEATLRSLEKFEDESIQQYRKQSDQIQDPDFLTIAKEIEQDERNHATHVSALAKRGGRDALDLMLKKEHWHRREGNWIGDAIYGVNDGLGAVFGIISGVAGFAASTHYILLSGLAGMVASALSMGSGAFLAAKSEREVFEAEISRERMEIHEDPEHEIEELKLLYQLKGFSEEEADMLTSRIQKNPEQFLQTMAQEELGLSEHSFSNPWQAAISGSLSTAVGAFIPLIPLFIWDGTFAIIMAAVISIVAHFIVGALKSMITIRSWWMSGLEMTWVGVIVGIGTYLLGLIGGALM